MEESGRRERHVQETRRALENALMALIAEKGYDAITVQDITTRANLGRTTFYTHFRSKKDLFLSCHESLRTINTAFGGANGLGAGLSPDMVTFLENIQHNRKIYYLVTRGSGGSELMQGVKTQIVANIQADLRQQADENTSAIPFDVLAQYIAGAQIALIGWWIDSRASYPARDLVKYLDQMQQALINDALKPREGI